MKKKSVKIHFGNLLLLIVIIGILVYGVYFMTVKLNNSKDDNNDIVNNKNENKLLDKLEDLGYSKSEAKEIESNMKEEDINKLEKKYVDLDKYVKIKYFHIENIERYDTLNKNSDYEIEDIIMRVNTGIDQDFYTNINTINNTDDLFVLVNKYNALPEDFVPTDLISVGNGQRMKKVAGEALIEMIKAIEADGLNLIAQSGYRSIELQTGLYNSYVARDGKEEADTYSARPGHSEHHTGLAIDVSHDGTLEKSFENTKQFEWLEKNAHKYGFIMRYPEDKIYMTGYDYEPWHYRYVGVETATLIKNEGITYEEYCVKYKGLY